METFSLIVYLMSGSAAPMGEFKGLTEYQCEHWREELRKEYPRFATVCRRERDGHAINPVELERNQRSRPVLHGALSGVVRQGGMWQ